MPAFPEEAAAVEERHDVRHHNARLRDDGAAHLRRWLLQEDTEGGREHDEPGVTIGQPRRCGTRIGVERRGVDHEVQVWRRRFAAADGSETALAGGCGWLDRARRGIFPTGVESNSGKSVHLSIRDP